MTDKPKCTHESTRFEARTGCYYIFCNDCDVKWMAVDYRDQARYEAMFESFGITETRQAPFYIRPLNPVKY